MTGEQSRERTDGAHLIAAERQRQLDAEGWTPEHDDEHSEGELVRAAICYATPAPERRFSYKQWAVSATGSTPLPDDWPWDAKWWKPTPNDRLRELVRAGALIAAEIDRLQRAGSEVQP